MPHAASVRIRGPFGAALLLALAGPAAAAPGMHAEALGIEPNGSATGQLGFSLAPAGDVNGDGYGDLVAGLPYWQDNAAGGRMTVYLGGPDGLSSANVIHRTLSQPFARLGWSVAGVGDVNGDGLDDVACGAPYYDAGEQNEGAVVLYYGRADDDLDGPVIFEMDEEGALFGWSVSWVGDTNGDGYDEVLGGAPEWGGFGTLFYVPVQGAARMYYGEAGTPTTFWGPTGGQEDMDYGFAVAGVGDVNGDGYNDVVVGAPLYQAGVVAANHGIARLYLGGPSGLPTSADWSVVGGGVEDRFGERASRAGDVNGDGYADFLLGSPSRTVAHSAEGGFELYHGGPSGPAATPAYDEDGGDPSDRLGFALAPSGDINGDGYADFMTRRTEPVGHNIVRTFLGGPAGLTETTTISNSSIDRFGESLAASDLDGDGRNELYLGGPDYNANAGGIWHFDARHADPTQNYAASPHWTHDGDNLNDGHGVGLAAGDLNGDGFDDLVIGTPGSDDGASEGGRVDVFLGSAGGLPTAPASPDWTYAGPLASSRLGVSVDIAGDVNGDGYADLIAGAPNADRVYVFHGNPSTVLSATPDWTYEFSPAPALFGQSVAGVGDVNADGYADVAAGAPLYTDAVVNEGLVRVFFGSPTGVQSTGFVTLDSGAAFNALFGQAVDGAGDVDADGFDDVIVGAPGQGATGDGMVYVFRGSAAGPVTPAVWTETGGGNGGAALGTCVAGVGDVDGDGFCDVAAGSPNYTTGGPTGRLRVFRGGASGIVGVWYQKHGPQSIGEAVAGAGDYDRDGRSDVLLSAPTYSIGGLILVVDDRFGFPDDTWYSGAVSDAGYSLTAGDFDGDGIPELVGGTRQDAAETGRVVLFEANTDGHAHGPRLPRQLTGGNDPVAEAGLTSETDLVRLAVKGWSAAGRTDLRMEHQVAAMGSAFGAISAASWIDAGAPGSPAIDFSADEAVSSATAYRWRLRVGSRDPAFRFSPWLSMPVTVATMKQLRTAESQVAVPPGDGQAGGGLLMGVRPNPAQGSCVVSFSIERPGRATVEVVDVTGRSVATVLDGPVPAGAFEVTWDGRTAGGRPVASGVYFLRVRAGDLQDSRQVLMVR
jgi:hypothetical protein